MADPVGTTATIIAAVQSTNALKETVRRIKQRNRTLGRLQNELEDLSNIIELVKHTDSTDIEMFALLQGPIRRCGQLCGDFQYSMNAFSTKSWPSLRDWTRMEFMKGDINEFIDTLAGYKSTISIGLGIITMHQSKVSDKVLEEYNNMVNNASYGLQENLKRIDEKLAQLTAKDIDNFDESKDLKDERGVTEQCLRICEDSRAYSKSLSNRKSILSPDLPQSAVGKAAVQQPFEAQRLTRAALDKNQEILTDVVDQLQKRLEILAVNRDSSENNERMRLQDSHTSLLENLGNLQSDQGKLEEAEEMYQRALVGYEKALGPDHTSTLDILNSLGNLYSDQGKLEEAEEMYQRALAGHEKALGPDHTSTLNILNSLGNLHSDQGKPKEAEGIDQGALAGHENALSPDIESGQSYGINSPDVSDSASVVTDFSYSGSPSSTTTINKSLELGGIEVFIQGLFRHGNFKMLCDDALEEKRIQRDRLQRNLVKLLRVFASNLSRENPDIQYANIPKFIRRYSFNIASVILDNISNSTIGKGLDESNVQLLRETDPGSRIKAYFTSADSQKQAFHPLANQETDDLSENTGKLDVENLGNDSATDVEVSGSDSDSPSRTTGNELQRAEAFLFESDAFWHMEKQLFDFVHPSFQSILMNWVQKQRCQKTHSPERLLILEELITEIRFIHPTAITISYENSYSPFNSFKGAFERLAGQEWDWWPLNPYMRGLAKDEVRLFWQCPCGDARWAEVPIQFAKRIVSATRILAASNVSDGQPTQTLSLTQHPTPSPQHQGGTLTQNHSLSLNSARTRLSRPSHGIANTSSQNISLHVFLVMMSKPIFDEYHILSQREISGMNNGEFFSWIRDTYYSHRGILPSWFGLRVYSHCEFYKLRRFDGYEYAPLKPEFPEPQEPYYHFDPKPMELQPPIDRHQFAHWFYKLSGQPISLRGLLRRPRRKLLNTSSNNNLIILLPKREMELEEGVSNTEDFWGLYIVERQSMFRAALWSLFLLLPSLYFFFAWLFQWGQDSDLQNASIPLILLLGPLCTFWGNILKNIGGIESKQKLS